MTDTLSLLQSNGVVRLVLPWEWAWLAACLCLIGLFVSAHPLVHGLAAVWERLTVKTWDGNADG